jgi:hypothetical protein
MAVYFWLISINWFWIEVFACGMTVVVILGSFWLPESPKYFLSTKKFDQAREAITYISKFNGIN